MIFLGVNRWTALSQHEQQAGGERCDGVSSSEDSISATSFIKTDLPSSVGRNVFLMEGWAAEIMKQIYFSRLKHDFLELWSMLVCSLRPWSLVLPNQHLGLQCEHTTSFSLTQSPPSVSLWGQLQKMGCRARVYLSLGFTCWQLQ